MYVALPQISEKCLQSYKNDPNTYKNFGEIHFLDNLFSNVNAILLLMVFVRTFKYMAFNDTMQQFSITLYRSAVSLIWFVFLFLIMIFAYAMSGVMLFGQDDKNFIDMKSAVLTLLKMLVSHIDYDSIYQANSSMAGLFVSSYIMLVFFFILVSCLSCKCFSRAFQFLNRICSWPYSTTLTVWSKKKI